MGIKEILLLAAIVLFLLIAVLSVAVLLLSRKESRARSDRASADSPRSAAPSGPSDPGWDDTAEEWEEVTSVWRAAVEQPVSDPVPQRREAEPAGFPAAKKKPRLTFREDRCCICGAPLRPDASKLFDYPLGGEARVDRACRQLISELIYSRNPEQFRRADLVLRSRLDTMDSVVKKILSRFLEQAESRFRPVVRR